MKVRIVEWCEYMSGCPADLEVTYSTILGVLVVDDDIETRGHLRLSPVQPWDAHLAAHSIGRKAAGRIANSLHVLRFDVNERNVVTCS